MITAIIFLVLMITANTLGVDLFLSSNNINSNIGELKLLVEANRLMASIVFVMLFSVCISLAIPVSAILALLGGMLFGIIKGTFLCVLAGLIGAGINFMLTRYVIGDYIEGKYGKKIEKINCEIDKYGHNYLMTMRLIPLFPFVIVNLAFALTSISFNKYMKYTAIGLIPGTFAYVYLGSGLSYISKNGVGLTPEILFPLILFGVMAMIPVVMKKLSED